MTFSLSFPLVPRWHTGPPPRISISACPSPVYWQSPMLVPRLSAPPPQISAMLFWACPSCASLARLLFGNLKTWPNLLLFTHAEIGSMLQLLSRSSFLIFSGQKILLVRPRHFVWNVSSFLQISFVIFQHSDRQSNTLRTLLLKILILVFTLSCFDFQTAFRLPKAWFALANLACTSLPLSPSVLTLLPR